MSALQQLELSLGSMGWGRYHTFLFWVCGLVQSTQGWAADMMWIMLVSVVMNEASSQWGLSDVTLSLYAMSQSAGVFLGSYFWGFMSDRRGRMFSFKKTLLLCGGVGVVASFSVNFEMLCCLAFVVGLGIGGDISVDGTVFIEFCPKSQRHMLTLMSFVCVLGSIFVPAIALLYTFVLPSYVWQGSMMTVSVLNIIFGLCRCRVLETPHFFVTHNLVESANGVLRRISEINNAPCEEIRITEDEGATMTSEFLRLSPDMGLKRQIKRLFTGNVRHTSIWFLLIWFFTSFTFSGFGVFMPEFLKRAGGSSHSSNADVYAAMTIQQSIGVLAVLGATLSVKSPLGRKWTQAFSLMLGAVFMFIFLVPFAYWAVLVCSTLFYLFSLMAYSVQYAYTPESFPADIRNTGVGLCSASNRLASVISPLIAGAMLESAHGTVGAVVLYSVSLFTAGMCGCVVRETRGADIEADGEVLKGTYTEKCIQSLCLL